MSHVTHMNESCHAHEWVMSHTWMSHVTHMNESCHTHEWVMSHTCYALIQKEIQKQRKRNAQQNNQSTHRGFPGHPCWQEERSEELPKWRGRLVTVQTTEKPRQMALKSPHKKHLHSKAPKMMSSTCNLKISYTTDCLALVLMTWLYRLVM